MDAFLNPRNGPSLTNIVDATAYSISLFQVNEQLKSMSALYFKQAFQSQNR